MYMVSKKIKLQNGEENFFLFQVILVAFEGIHLSELSKKLSKESCVVSGSPSKTFLHLKEGFYSKRN